jgi:glycosyltransferase involved in cell wall biosynthesis
MVEDMGLQANITFSDTSASPVMGLDKEQMARLYQISDFHVSATGGEGFGIPSLEAMACGLPIILPDNSTGPELIGGERGWLVDNATTIIGPSHGNTMTLVDIDALSSALVDAVWTDETTYRAMRKACIEYGELHDYNINANHMLDFIVKVRGTAHPQGNRGATNDD